MEVGSRITLRGAEWTVVGVFESQGDQHEAEMFTGVETLQSAFRRNAFQSVTVQLDSAVSFPEFEASLTNNPALSVDVLRESHYYKQQSKAFTQVLAVVAYLVSGIMALGAALGALNSMYTAVSGRAVEIATLRVLGFGPAPIAISVFAEALLLAVTGGVLGACLAWLIFNGHVISTSGAGISPARRSARRRATYHGARDSMGVCHWNVRGKLPGDSCGAGTAGGGIAWKLTGIRGSRR